MKFVITMTIIILITFAVIGGMIGYNLKQPETIFYETVKECNECVATTTEIKTEEAPVENQEMISECQNELENCWYSYGRLKNEPECPACVDNSSEIESLKDEIVNKNQAIRELENFYKEQLQICSQR